MVRYRVLGIKDSSKTVVKKSDSGRQVRNRNRGVERVRPLRDRDIFQSKRSANWKGFIKDGEKLSELAIDLEL